jgi:hypothetical protein
LLPELEEAMVLLAFSDQATSPVAHLVKAMPKERLADEVNAAILTMQKQPTGICNINTKNAYASHHHFTPYSRVCALVAKLLHRIKLLVWSQQELVKKRPLGGHITSAVAMEAEVAAVAATEDSESASSVRAQ